MSIYSFPVFLPDLGLTKAMPPRIPHGAFRHAAPPGPWPWQDVVEDESPFFLDWDTPPPEEDKSNNLNTTLWKRYPSAFFPNWTSIRLERSGLAALLRPPDPDRNCAVYHTDVSQDGHFSEVGRYAIDLTQGAEKRDELWNWFKSDQSTTRRVRVLSVENLSGDVMQMLGTIHRIEPFFFSSSLNWIPSRYQEDVNSGHGDHITVILTFLRTMPDPMTAANTPMNQEEVVAQMVARGGGTNTIDTQAPLVLRSSRKVLLLDLLALHMVRRKNGSTIITFHPSPEWKSTSAAYLQSRVHYAGQSVYWQRLFRRSSDPTMVLLCILWYALYAWDESLENLYSHISSLESRVLVTNDIHLTRELHIIRASLLHYASLLESFHRTVLFVRATPNPALENEPEFEECKTLMTRECDTLLSEIDRMQMFRRTQEMRLENIINLAFSSVNFEDSRFMKHLTEASLRDSATMKQLSYLTMIFLPATFVATLFGMNIKDLQDDSKGAISQYLMMTIPLTAFTIWIIMALHRPESENGGFLMRLMWPISASRSLFGRMRGRKRMDDIV